MHKAPRFVRFPIGFAVAIAVCLPFLASAAGVRWPEDHLLPTFAKPARVLDCVDITDASDAEVNLFVSLEGIVNRTEPRIACVTEGGEGEFKWLDSHKLKFRLTDGYDAVLKYRDSVKGLVATDPDLADTLNLATTMAGVNDELICAPELLGKLTNAPYKLPVLDDLRGKFADKYEVYGYLYSNYWPRCTHRIFAGMGPRGPGHLRDYLIALKVATVWLGPGKKEDAALLKMFVSEMKPLHGIYMGWWPGEGDGLEWIAHYGIPVLASDFFRNGTVFSGVRSKIHIPKIPAPPPLENKVYVAMILSDGDNIQYMQHAMRMDWDRSNRGTVPIGWTVSPLAVDMDPGMLDYFWTTATTNDCLVSGPSGAGYTHVNHWYGENLAEYTRISAPYLKKSGLRVITIWDRVDRAVARAFATNCPSLLGLTDQSGHYNKVNLGLRTIPLTPTYTSTRRELREWITNAAAGWDGTAPKFIAAQANVWHMRPEDLAAVASMLDTNEYRLVRPDQLFILANREKRKR